MTLTGIRWANIAGRDIHLPPGLVSPRLGGLLGNPARIECAVAVDGAGPVPVTLAQLGLRPVDLLLLTQAGGGGGGRAGCEGDGRGPRIVHSAS